MIKHVVMWKLQPFAEAGPAEANAERMKEDLEGLKNTIKEIRSIEVGINKIVSRDSFDVVLIAEFDNEKDLEAYQNHPAHKEIGEWVNKVRLLRKVVDYEL
jgi:hypothetical protein